MPAFFLTTRAEDGHLRHILVSTPRDTCKPRLPRCCADACRLVGLSFPLRGKVSATLGLAPETEDPQRPLGDHENRSRQGEHRSGMFNCWLIILFASRRPRWLQHACTRNILFLLYYIYIYTNGVKCTSLAFVPAVTPHDLTAIGEQHTF